jgi:hypothetical protein
MPQPEALAARIIAPVVPAGLGHLDYFSSAMEPDGPARNHSVSCQQRTGETTMLIDMLRGEADLDVLFAKAPRQAAGRGSKQRGTGRGAKALRAMAVMPVAGRPESLRPAAHGAISR